MSFSHDVPMMDGGVYTVKSLLASGKSNAKTAKSDKASMGYVTKSLSLAPAKASGFNLCSSASAGCKAGCLYTSGMAMMVPRTIFPARIAKSRLLRLSPKIFRDQLTKELANSIKTAKRHSVNLAVRLNVYSDVMWEREMPGLIESFPDIQFYDYTKHYLRMMRYIGGKFPSNYHLTFSWSGVNENHCLSVLDNGGNVAVPFHVKYKGDNRKPLPLDFMGYPIIDGDITDLRFLDPQGGKIVGLRVKGKAKKDFDSGFVVAVAA